jgi:hypothetical protein
VEEQAWRFDKFRQKIVIASHLVTGRQEHPPEVKVPMPRALPEYPAIERWLRRVMTLPGFIDMPGILTPWSGEAPEEQAI